MNTETEKSWEVIKIGRLQRRILRLLKKIDFLNEKIATYDKFMLQYAYMEGRIKTQAEKLAERDSVGNLEARIKEQAALIERLMKETA